MDYMKSERKMRTVPGGGATERYRVVVIVGIVFVVMTSVIVGVTVWVVTQQESEGSAYRKPTETIYNYVAWDEADAPESDARVVDRPRMNEQPEAKTKEKERTESDGSQIQASLGVVTAGYSRGTSEVPPYLESTHGYHSVSPRPFNQADYSTNMANVMKHLQSQQEGPGQGGNVQNYGTVEPYQPGVPRPPILQNPNRIGDLFDGNHEISRGQQPSNPHPPPPFGQDHGSRPFQMDWERQLFNRREQGSDRPPFRQRLPPRRPEFFGREGERNHSYVSRDPVRSPDTATNAGFDLAVSGWSAFSFGMFILKKLVQIMGYGRESRMIPDESTVFLRMLDITGKVMGFDASEQLAFLNPVPAPEGRSGGDDDPSSAPEAQPDPLDLINNAFRVGLNLVNLYITKGEMNIAECLWGAYCENLDRKSKLNDVEGIVAKVNTIGLELIRGDVEDYIGVGEVMNKIKNFDGGKCGKLFPACHGNDAIRFLSDLFGDA